MAITKNKAGVIERISERELREDRYFGVWGGYYYGGHWGYDDYYDNDYYHDYCYRGYSDCNCPRCSECEYTSIYKEDALGNERRLCIPAGKEWFRKSQIDALLSEEEIPTPITLMHSKMIEVGLAA